MRKKLRIAKQTGNSTIQIRNELAAHHLHLLLHSRQSGSNFMGVVWWLNVYVCVLANGIYTPHELPQLLRTGSCRLSNMFQLLKSTAVLIAAALFLPLVASQGVSAPPGFNM